MRAYQDYVIFKLDDPKEGIYHTKTGVKGIGGKELMSPVDKEDDAVRLPRIKYSGIVEFTPRRLSNRFFWQLPQGSPKYISKKGEYIRRNDIAPEVQAGDKIYFHFNTLAQEMNHLAHGRYKVAYENIICAIREHDDKYNEMVMIGGHCLIRPDIESWDDITIPTYKVSNGVPLVDAQGNKIKKPKDQWIQIKVVPEARSLRGFVVNCGTPLKMENDELAQDDHIIYRKNADWELTIEQQQFYVIRQMHIIAKINKNINPGKAANPPGKDSDNPVS